MPLLYPDNYDKVLGDTEKLYNVDYLSGLIIQKVTHICKELSSILVESFWISGAYINSGFKQ